MADQNLDGMIAINDAQIKSAEAEADIAVKLTQAEIQWQQAVKGALENLRRFMEIQWDAEAHHHLLRRRTEALQRERALRNESIRLQQKLKEVNALFAGSGMWESIRNGWIAFNYLRNAIPVTLKPKVVVAKPTPECFLPSSWHHVSHPVEEYQGPQDGGLLLEWARQHTYFPLMDGPAYVYMSQILQNGSDAAAEEAKIILAAVEAAQKDARELEDKGWDRIKTQSTFSS